MAVRGGQLILVHRRARLGCCGASSVEDDGPDPGLERTLAPERTASAHRACKRLLHGVTCAVRVTSHACCDSREDIEPTAIQRFEFVETSSAASGHTRRTR